MRKQIPNLALLLVASCGAAMAQTSYTFAFHQVWVTSDQNCTISDTPTAIYTTATTTIPIAADCNGASLQGQLTLASPAVAPLATQSGNNLQFPSPFQISAALAGTYTTPDGTFYSDTQIIDGDMSQPQDCPTMSNLAPVPQGTSNFLVNRPCSLTTVAMSNVYSADHRQWFILYYSASVELLKAGNPTASVYVRIETNYATAPPPANVDLSVDHLELVQTVQHPDNSIPLVAGKSTAARIFVKLNGDNPQPVAGVTGYLHGSRNDIELAGSPLSPVNGPITAPVTFLRSNTNDSLNFLLPKDWTAVGSLRLIAEVVAPASANEQNTANNLLPQNVTFTAPANMPDPIYVYYWPMCYQPPGTNKLCPTANIGAADELLAKLYPLAGVQYVPWQVPEKVWRQPVNTVADIDTLFVTLQKFYNLLDQEKGGIDQLATWFPYHPGSSTILGDSNPVFLGGAGRVTYNVDTSVAKGQLDAAMTLAHETGHNLGLRHTNTADGCGAEDPKTDWPYKDSTIHEVGMDPATMEVKPASKKDVMSYCSPPGSNIWISDHNYQVLMNSQVLKRAAAAAHPQSSPATAAAAQYMLVSGSARADGAAGQLDPAYQFSASTPAKASDPAGNYCLRLTAAGNALTDYCFTLTFQSSETFEPLDQQSFSLKVPCPAGITRIALRHGSQELAAVTPAAKAPTLQLTAPQAGAQWDGAHTITWTGADPGGHALSYVVEYSPDGGASWLPLDVDVQQPQFDFDTAEIQAGAQTYFRVLGTNGVNTAAATVGPVTIVATPRVEVTPARLDFGVVPVGQTSDQTLWLRNKGNGPLAMQSLAIDNTVFAAITPAAPLTIAAGGRQAVTVRFTPAAAGAQSGTLTIVSNDAASGTTTVMLTGGQTVSSSSGSIAVSPNTLDFGSINANTTKDLTLSVQNTGMASLTVTGFTMTNALFSVTSPAPPFTLATGGQQTVVVRFSPTTAGAQSGSLGIASDDPAIPSVSISLAGQGAAGSIPHISPGGVMNAASSQAGISSGSWITIYGDRLSGTTRIWGSADFTGNKLPAALDGVSVQVNGKPAAVYFISPAQINALAPSDSTLGPVNVTVTNPQGTSAAAAATLQVYSPAFFLFDPQNRRYLAAEHSNGKLLGKPGLFGSAVSTLPAKPGEIISLFGTGFGPTNPPEPADELFQGAAPLADPGQLTIQIG
ncbi:MAG TPA: choice-of-anchor D domain-containing protein, partial [Bryobacterales bacterium]|nr:choice-of-anchor D domain-containing protein [Bryobacterales bacterium]